MSMSNKKLQSLKCGQPFGSNVAMNTKPCKTAENHAPTVRKTMGVTVAKSQPETDTMTDNSADNDSTKTTDNDDDTPTVSGVELDSVVGVENAFKHSYDPCNVANIDIRRSEDLLIIQSREACFSHMGELLAAHKQGHIDIKLIIAGTNHDGDPCLKIEVVGGDE